MSRQDMVKAHTIRKQRPATPLTFGFNVTFIYTAIRQLGLRPEPASRLFPQQENRLSSPTMNNKRLFLNIQLQRDAIFNDQGGREQMMTCHPSSGKLSTAASHGSNEAREVK